MLHAQVDIESAALAEIKIAGAILIAESVGPFGNGSPAMVMPDGRAMIEWTHAALRKVAPRVVTVGSPNRLDDLNGLAPALTLPTGPRPLDALETLLGSKLAERYLILAHNQPLVSRGLLERLLDAPRSQAVCLRARHGHLPAPLPCLLEASLLPFLKEFKRHGGGRLSDFLETIDCATEEVNEAAAQLVNRIDSPEELCCLTPGCAVSC